MPRNNGIYEPPVNNWNPAIDDRPMDPGGWNQLLEDIADALTQSVSKDGQTVMTGDLDFNGHLLRKLGAAKTKGDAIRLDMLEKGKDIASANTISIPMEGQLFSITGTVNIQKINALYAGRFAFLEFKSALTITASANLVVPGTGDYTTSANEIMLFVSVSPSLSHLYALDITPENIGAVATGSSAYIRSYQLGTSGATTLFNLGSFQVFRVAATVNRSFSFVNPPGANRSMTVVVHLYDNNLSSRTINWPSGINWDRGAPPILDGTKATVILFWTGTEWIGSLGSLS